ncbi:MAG: hypothetical protein PVI06_09470 [Desulfobacterales bacterium]
MELEFNKAWIINIGTCFSDDLSLLKQMMDYTPEETHHLFAVFFKVIEDLDSDAVGETLCTVAPGGDMLFHPPTPFIPVAIRKRYWSCPVRPGNMATILYRSLKTFRLKAPHFRAGSNIDC